MQCDLYIQNQRNQLPLDRDQFRFIIANLTGKVREWATALWSQESPVLSSYNQFKQYVTDVFDHPAAGRDTGNQLVELKQYNRTAAEYALDFRVLAAGSGWSKPALLTVYRRGLSATL